MQRDESKRIRELVHQELGIALGPDKQVFLSCRLRPLLERHGLREVEEYADWLEENRNATTLGELADAISTNHTFFYREPAHFELLSKQILDDILARLRSRGSFDLRVWSAAASTGEEPYTLAILLRERLRHERDGWRAGVLATDISQEALEKARVGVYPEEEVCALPEPWVQAGFRKAEPGMLRVCEEIKREVTFRRLNLMRRSYPFNKRFDVVFCRNVMIYFTADTRRQVVDRLDGVLNEGGYLFVGLSETLDRATTGFEFVAPGIFRKPVGGGTTEHGGGA